MVRSIVAAFPDPIEARKAVADLVTRGHQRDGISVIMHDSGDARALLEHADSSATTRTGRTGAVVGASLWGLAAVALAVPPIGLIGAGPLLAALGGAGFGAAAGGLLGRMVGLGIPEHEAVMRAKELEHGGVLVSVKVTDAADEQHARDVLSRHGPVTEFAADDERRDQHVEERADRSDAS